MRLVPDRPPVPDALELRHLRALLVVGEERSLSRAAARLFLAPSTLSRQVSALERAVGCLLVERSTQATALTLAGEVLAEHARRLLADAADAVAETRSVGGELAARIARMGEPFDRLTFADVGELRAAAERHYAQLPVRDDVTVEPVVAGGVPGLCVTPASAGPDRLLLLHGGGYVSGSPFGFRSLASALAAACGGSVLVPDYRLAPEHPHPAALEDVLATYQWWLTQGVDPDDVTVVGETSGAGLALAVLLELVAGGRPLPGRVVLTTPWVDLSGSAPDRLPAEPAPSNTEAGMALGPAYYLAGTEPTGTCLDPLGSDLSLLPPLLVQAAAHDFRVADAMRLAAHARAQGVDVTLTTYDVTAQGFPMYWSFLPAAAGAIREVAAFVRHRPARHEGAGGRAAGETSHPSESGRRPGAADDRTDAAERRGRRRAAP